MLNIFEMEYNNKNVRRQDRLLAESRARELLENAEYGVMSMADENGIPYGIPVNFVWDGGNSIFVHCAPEGKKLRILQTNDNVSFCVVGKVRLLPDKFTTEYESIVLKGKARTGLSEVTRMNALKLLLRKLSPNDYERGVGYAEKSFARTEIIRLDIDEWSGKAKKV